MRWSLVPSSAKRSIDFPGHRGVIGGRATYSLATLVIAKLDCLARNVALTSNLMESGVEFVAVDMPRVNRFVVHTLAAVADRKPRPSRREPRQPSPPQERVERSSAAVASWLSGLRRSERRRGKCVARKGGRSARSSFRRSQPFKPPARAHCARSQQNSMLVRYQRLEDMGNGLRFRCKELWSHRERQRLGIP
jgi:hypothetical protein